MPEVNLQKAFLVFSVSCGLLCLSAGSVSGKPGALPAPAIVEDSIPHLGRIAHSPDQLIRNALSRLITLDTAGLMLMVPNTDQMMAIYSKTPEGKKASEVQRNFAREFYYMDNGKLLFRRLGRDGGRNIDLVSWKATLDPLPLEGGGRILRGIEIRIKDWSANKIRRLHFVQSIYVDPQGCKIWGFEDDKGGKHIEG